MEPTPPIQPAIAEDLGRPYRRDLVASLTCTLIGVALAVAPHVANPVAVGIPEFLADNDDDYYLALSRPAYHGEIALRDPFAGRREHLPELHAWAQFAPPGWRGGWGSP